MMEKTNARLNADKNLPPFGRTPLASVVRNFRTPYYIVEDAHGERYTCETPPTSEQTLCGYLPGVFPEWLGDRSFGEIHGVRFPYVTGAMANGIASIDLVKAAAAAGGLGFFGSAGLPFPRVEAAVETLLSGMAGRPFGMNLIHSPHEPDLEAAIVDLYLARGITRVSASAYMGLTPMVVQYSAAGLFEKADGSIGRKNFLFAKISRPETAARFLAPAPKTMLDALVSDRKITAKQAELAARVPVAEDITVEADSGGHTDNQILTAVFPSVLRQKHAAIAAHGYTRPIRVGAAGGLGTPDALAAAFALGAAYVVTGSVNQAAVESGLSSRGKALLAKAQMGDVMMAPAADMFEMGVKVQVLKRGAMFGNRAQRLYDVYKKYPSLEAIAPDEKKSLEKELFQDTLENVWRATHKFFEVRDPAQNARAETDKKHQMALVFRWYLGQSSRWAISGDEKRALDFQIWCGPAMGAFNAWVKGSFLEPPEARSAGQIAKNLLEGACAIARAQALRHAGVAVPDTLFHFAPRPLA